MSLILIPISVIDFFFFLQSPSKERAAHKIKLKSEKGNKVNMSACAVSVYGNGKNLFSFLCCLEQYLKFKPFCFKDHVKRCNAR